MMADFGLYLATAFALIFVIEGLIYALFPDSVRRMFALALTMKAEQLRMTGAAMAAFGFLLVWLLRRLAGS